MRFRGMRGSLAAMALLLSGRALALALGCIGGLAVLLLLSLQLHLALLHGLSLGSFLHGDLLGLLRVHTRPDTADVRWLVLADNGVGVDKVCGRAVSGEIHGWRHGGGLRLVEVHAHLSVHVDTGRPAAAAEAAVHVHVDARVEAVHHVRVHRQVLDASEGEADLLLVLVVVVARAVEVLALFGLIEGREGVPVLAGRLRCGIRACCGVDGRGLGAALVEVEEGVHVEVFGLEGRSTAH